MTIQITNQQGFTLVISLIFMIVLTILGLTSIQSTRTELSMAGNLRESDKSFQSAEIGLHSAEQFITETTSKTTYNDSNGLISNTSDDPDYFDVATWDDAQTSKAALTDVHASPKFIIKYLGDRSQNDVAKVNIGGYGSDQPGFTVSNFRVTTRGFGQTDHAVTMLQTYYGKE